MKRCTLSGLEIVPFLQSVTAEKCAGMATFVIKHSDKLENLRAVLVHLVFYGESVFIQEWQFSWLISPVDWHAVNV